MKKRTALVLLLLVLSLVSVLAQAQEVSHYLLLGFDYWGDTTIGTSFSDTNLVLSVDTANSRILIASMMRDSYVTMPEGRQSKLNQVVRKSDFDTMVATVENTLDIEIKGYVAISAPGFARLVGELGGIEVEISKAEYEAIKDKNDDIPGPGRHTLRGNALLTYVRDRSLSGHDALRTDKAREVMGEMMKKAKAMSSMELMAFASKAFKEVKTDMGLMDMVALATAALGMEHVKFENMALPVKGTYKPATVKGNSIIDADWEENRKLYHAFIAGESR